MTYCVAIAVDQGLVFASDSRTNAGPDQVSVFGKMHVLLDEPERFFVLLSAGNLGTTQAVRTRIRHDLEFDRRPNLKTVQSMAEAAEYLGAINSEQRRKHADGGEKSDHSMTATFILGGQIAGRSPGILLIYPEGNYIRASNQTPFLQIGELKYGKPILDRLVRPGLTLEDTARVALLSMDATMRSNVTVGAPIEVLIFNPRKRQLRHMIFGQDDDYLRELGRSWQGYVEKAFSVLPPLPPRPAELLRVVDE